ncbi:uncharacterized protein SPPG_01280 [Spizellomyces punctatus DAOM BR117]|uniref:FRG1-like family protein n=1 Tax=Spizellomyces punctatus (strain DAOM BR117) TaxID=645134 RepID=A0A0L0HSE2_SPIPD|nr:uncharacterized protein SPPG_01280 [Spizellomyces punctatus DAOM BR117]KND03825.1 hypothetical protein SPPG_01280 [Spizellomyces punctatus DAOM BR117]|eukprot:XP_016611864.1 hypothetical protein SPPG_01280 [Spizellomyces punctatus DAOM BR117]
MRKTKLSFKGDNTIEKKKKKKRKAETEAEETLPEDGWVAVDHIDDIKGPILLLTTSTDPASVLNCSDSSSKVQFTPIDPATPLASYEPTTVSQVFVAKRLPDSSKLCFRSAYDRYLGSDKFGVVQCEREAMGPSEEWEVVLREDGLALQSSFEKFLKCDADGRARADSENVGFKEVFQMRCQAANKARAKKKKVDVSINAEELEVDHIKKFHSWGGGRLVLSQEDTTVLRKAKKEGNLNETLLDRRSKLKSDKFCK